MRPSQLLAAVLAVSSTTAALSDAFDNIHGLAEVKNVLFGRQNDNSDNASSDSPQATPAPRSSGQPAQTSNNNNNNDNQASATNSASGTGRASGSGSRTTTGKPKATSFDPRLPAGGISMLTPNALAGDAFYRVGQWVTFAWNYTSLSVTPTAIDIMASCTDNQAMYTIAVNHSAKATQVLWNTGDQPSGQPPFLTSKYNLIIYDSDSSVSAAPQAGYLGVFKGLSFGMYTLQPYADVGPDGVYNCPTCSGALSHFEKMTLRAMLFTTGTTVGSLLYFTYQFGLW